MVYHFKTYRSALKISDPSTLVSGRAGGPGYGIVLTDPLIRYLLFKAEIHDKSDCIISTTVGRRIGITGKNTLDKFL
jgi:hypothetical protein